MKTKQCSACTLIKSVDLFYVDNAKVDCLKNRCVECETLRRPSVIKQKRGAKPSNIPLSIRKAKVCYKYEKTRKGHLMRTYRNMLSRVLGIQKKNIHLYLGLPILDKQDFYIWALTDKEYNELYDSWVKNNYLLSLCPSIDRIDSDKGYIKGNIRWLTQSQNSSKKCQRQLSLEISTIT
jgi:hypothetical protein